MTVLVYKNFYCLFSCYFLSSQPVSGVYTDAVNTTWAVQPLRLALSRGTNTIGIIHLYLGMETDPVTETLRFLVLEYRTIEKVKKKKTIILNYSGIFNDKRP
jgi:hypothetical protein